MSGFIGAAQPTGIPTEQDLRLTRADLRVDSIAFDDGMDAVAGATFVTGWWPGTAGFLGSLGADVALLAPVEWSLYDPAAGASSRYAFVGITRDQYGSPLGACTVKLYRTSDDALLDTTTSDSTGAFLLNTPYYPDAHYMVAHKSGSPDVDGVTVNTLIGT